MRDKVKQFFVYFLIALCILTLVLPLLTLLVYADPLNTKVQQLIVTGDVNVKNMINAVENEDGHEGDKSQHRWVSPVFGGSVTDNKVLNHIKENAVSPITNEEIEPEQKAVVVFTGEDNLESKISGYGEWFDNDWLNRDSSNLEPHKYSATALGRAISGYTYYVLEKKYTTGSIPDDAVHIKYHGNPIADSYTPIEHTTTVTNEDGTTTTKHLGFWYWVEKPVKKPGYCKYWKDEKAKVYVSSLGPQSKALNEEERDEKNKKVKEFNSEFKKVLFESGPLRAIKPPDNFYDIFDKTLDANPYYKDGNRDSKNNYGTHFSDHTLNWIFHLFWNTILLDNPMEKPPEPLDFSLYALSSSLTAYCNDVLSGKNTMISGVPEIIEPKNAGQAGALVGYGDKDYEFSPFITSNQSSTASVVSYKALKDTNDNMYEYALYGRLLNDLGLDKTGMVKLGGMQRTIPGGVLTILYIVASSVSILFSGTMQILKTINPFSFLTKAQTISSFWREQMGTTNVANLGNVSINNTLVNLLDAIGEIYDGFVNISILGVLPIMLALLLGSVLLLKNANKFSKVKAFLVRLVFVTCGIPILGTVYTALLDNVSSMTLTTSAPTSQIISATFVDFEMWAKNSRLSPVKENGELFEIITSDDTKNVSGSDATYSSLRKIIANTNKKSGVIDDVDISMYQSADSENKVTANALAHINELTPGATMLQNKSAFEEGLALLQKYTSGAFYNASDFDSDTLAAFTRYHRDKIGSLQDTRKPEDSGDDSESTPAPPVENENTNEDTLYELFDNSNESKDWSSRSQEDNKAIFDGNQEGGFAGKWKEFNFFSNGTLKASKTQGGSISYSDTPVLNESHDKFYGALCPCNSIGLSSLSLYNYLSSDFNDSNVVIHSNVKSASQASRTSHYSVNIAGSSALGALYYFNCFAILFCVAIMGVSYGLAMIINSVKRTVHMIISIPFALVGFMKSIIEVITITFAMVIEVVVTMVCYSFITHFVFVLVGMVEGPLRDLGTSASGFLLGISTSDISYYFTMFVFSTLLTIFTFLALKVRKSFMFAYKAFVEFLLFKLLDERTVVSYLKEEYLEKDSEKITLKDFVLIWQLQK